MTTTTEQMRERIDANRLEQMAKERPDDFFLKGSGVLKLLSAIRQLERELREAALAASPAPTLETWTAGKTFAPGERDGELPHRWMACIHVSTPGGFFNNGIAVAGFTEEEAVRRRDTILSLCAAAPQLEAAQPAPVPLEIRLTSNGALDEIVGTGQFHLEQMDDGHWWMHFEDANGEYADVNLTARGAIKANFEHSCLASDAAPVSQDIASLKDECIANGNHQRCYRVRCNLGKECVAAHKEHPDTERLDAMESMTPDQCFAVIEVAAKNRTLRAAIDAAIASAHQENKQ